MSGRDLVTTVLFACVHNAGRSQMAAAWFNAMADGRRARALSAGTRPADHVHPEVIAAMRDVGVDVSHMGPALLTADLAQGVNVLVTMGCGEACPIVPGVERVDWDIDDPKGQSATRVGEIRDVIRQRVAHLIDARSWTRQPQSMSGGV